MFKIKKLLQWKRQMRSVVLDVKKKNAVQKDIVAFMKAHPVRIETSPRLIEQISRGNMFSFLTQKHMFATLAVVLTLLVGSGTAFAAENTLPGDPLYGVKVHVNEEVRGALAFTPEAKAHWETRKAERRLEEAAQLAAQGQLKVDAETELQAKFEKHTEKIKEQIAELQSEGNVEAAANLSSRLESALEIHEEILTKINSEEGATKEEVKPLLKELKNEVKAINHIRTKIDSDVETRVGTEAKTAAEGRMNASLNHINEVRDYLEDRNVGATSSAMLTLEGAVKVHESGKTEFNAGNYGKAFILFGQAQRMAQEAKVMTHVKAELKLRGIELDADTRIKIEDRIEARFDEKREERKEDRKEERREDKEDKLRDHRVEILPAATVSSALEGVIRVR